MKRSARSFALTMRAPSAFMAMKQRAALRSRRARSGVGVSAMRTTPRIAWIRKRYMSMVKGGTV
jgi:hypothetical protein